MLFGQDDFAERVSASGMSAQQYAVTEQRERMRRLWKPVNSVPDDNPYSRDAKRKIEAHRAELERIEAENKAKIEAEYRKQFWRLSWIEMCRLAKLAKELSTGFVDSVDNTAEEVGLQRKFARDIMREICEKHGISRRDFISHRRWKNLCEARMEFYWRCRDETALSFPQIGKICGDRDHSTVIHGARKHQDRLDNGEAV